MICYVALFSRLLVLFVEQVSVQYVTRREWDSSIFVAKLVNYADEAMYRYSDSRR